MNISGATQAMPQVTDTGDTKRTQLQAALLRKTLDSQQEQAAELLRMLEGKGQILDIRA
jgi:hypothetical protein